MTSKWPVYNEENSFTSEETEFQKLMTAIVAVRNRRAEMNVPPSKKAKVCIATSSIDTFISGAVFFNKLASASSVEVEPEFDLPGAVRVVTDDAIIFIPMNELIDFDVEIIRLKKELEAAEKDKEFYAVKLRNKNFTDKAPAAVVESQREQMAKADDRIVMLKESITQLENQMQ